MSTVPVTVNILYRFIAKMSYSENDAHGDANIQIEMAEEEIQPNSANLSNNHYKTEEIINQSNTTPVQHLQFDMTCVVEGVAERMAKNNDAAFQKLTNTLSEHLSKLTGSLEPLVAALSSNHNNGRNAGKLPADHNDQNTGKLPVGQADTPTRRSATPRSRLQDSEVLSLRAGSVVSHKSKRCRSASSKGDESSIACGNSSKQSTSHRANLTAKKQPSRTSHRSSSSTMSSKSAAKSLDADQSYWESQVTEYEENLVFGPEISSSLAGASKIFWTKSLSDEKTKKVMESSKIPNNCQFMAVKLVNKEIWTVTASDIRTKDWALQKIQSTHNNMTSNVLQASSELDNIKDQWKTLVQENPGIKLPDLNPAVDKLKDALKLAGRTNQKINDYRREAFKPSIPKNLTKLLEKPEENAILLFGDNLKARMEEIKGDNSIKQELAKRDSRSIFKWKDQYQMANKKQRVGHSSTYRSNWKAPQNAQSGSTPGFQQPQYKPKNDLGQRRDQTKIFQKQNNRQKKYRNNR